MQGSFVSLFKLSVLEHGISERSIPIVCIYVYLIPRVLLTCSNWICKKLVIVQDGAFVSLGYVIFGGASLFNACDMRANGPRHVGGHSLLGIWDSMLWIASEIPCGLTSQGG